MEEKSVDNKQTQSVVSSADTTLNANNKGLTADLNPKTGRLTSTPPAGEESQTIIKELFC